MKATRVSDERLVVRPIAHADRPQWERLWRGYNRFYERGIPRETTDTTWSRFFSRREDVHALVAERDGRIVGFVHYVFHRSTSLVGPTCYCRICSPRRRHATRASAAR